MDINDLKESGGLVSDELVPREVEWTHAVDGAERTDKFSIFVKKASFGFVERVMTGDAGQQTIEFIRECVRLGEEGEQKLTKENVESLDPSLALLFVNEVREVNGVGDDPKA